MNQSIIKSDQVRIEDSAAEPASALPDRTGQQQEKRSTARGQKSVQVLREKNVVHAIEVRCSCGEITVVELEYDPREG